MVLLDSITINKTIFSKESLVYYVYDYNIGDRIIAFMPASLTFFCFYFGIKKCFKDNEQIAQVTF